MPQYVETANAITAIGRERDAVRKEKDLAHQPRPRAIQGPTRLATHKGRRCHAAT
jgi:hypothetical protein